MIEIAHQRRAGGPVGHLLGGAAHVDVNDLGALRLGNAGPLRHPNGFATGELHDADGDTIVFAAQLSLALAAGKPRTGRHFRNHQPGPQPFGQAAERRVGDPRHRRQNHAIWHGHRPDLQRPEQNGVDFVQSGIDAYHLGDPQLMLIV